ncbi:MAG: hypothetical protein JRC93_03935 [Deltaproteobacteria bacterium]|nr:hypothetical protein [Deltaproteobacteria bacterium]
MDERMSDDGARTALDAMELVGDKPCATANRKVVLAYIEKLVVCYTHEERVAFARKWLEQKAEEE